MVARDAGCSALASFPRSARAPRPPIASRMRTIDAPATDPESIAGQLSEGRVHVVVFEVARLAA